MRMTFCARRSWVSALGLLLVAEGRFLAPRGGGGGGASLAASPAACRDGGLTTPDGIRGLEEMLFAVRHVQMGAVTGRRRKNTQKGTNPWFR